VTTQKKDLLIKDVEFYERNKPDPGASWQEKLPLHLTHKLVKSDTTLEDGFLQYKLDLMLQLPDNYQTTYGEFTITSNHPKKTEVTLKGVLLKNKK
jgi:hypothetical protein